MTEKISEIKPKMLVNDDISSPLYKISKVAEKLFDKLDTDKSGGLSVFEMEKGGITFLDSEIAKNDFVNIYRGFAESTSTLQGVMKGFEEHFYTLDEENIIRDVDISSEQRKELIRRIELFNLAKPLLNEDIKGNDSFLSSILSMLKSDKNITNRMLALVLLLTNPNKSVSDGKIGAFRQGDVGDCWFLSALNCYASTKEGAQNIQERIKNNGNGKYTVTFQNPFDPEKQEQYCVFDKTISNKQNKKTVGDKDVQILEVAFGIYLEKYAGEDLKEKGKEYIHSGSPEKGYLLHRALGYTDPIKTYTKGDGRLLECFHYGWENSDGKLSFLPMYTWAKYSSFKDIIEKNNFKAENLLGSISEKNKEKFIDDEYKVMSARHEYNLMKFSNEKVVFNNPHLSSFPIARKEERFEELFSEISYLPQTGMVSCSPDKEISEYSRPNKIIGSATSAGECIWGACKMSAIWLYKTIVNAF